jgi:hypothetical protein
MTQHGIGSRRLTPAGHAQPGHRMWPNGPPRWLTALALLAIPALLLAFVQVARQGVRQGEIRRAAMAARADATWRCNVTIDRRERERCLQRIDAMPISVVIAADDPV